MKLVIQIPSYNEAKTLGDTIADLPRKLPEFEDIVILVIDDGSKDNTAEIALECGADYVVRHRRNLGLSQTFLTGLSTALALGADVIVNTDADNQYPGRYIHELIKPIVSGDADLVIGDRKPSENIHFPRYKRFLEVLGSWVIRALSQTDVPDAVSGFRAFSRYAALRVQVYNNYSYTLETLIQAGKYRMGISHVSIETNPASRPSRLHKGVVNFIWRQSGTVIRSIVLYQPLRIFVLLGIPFLLIGGLLITRFLFFYLVGESGIGRYVQSVSIGGTLLLFGLLLTFMGFLGDAIRANRKMLEEILVRLRSKSVSESATLSEIDGFPIIKNKKT